MFITRGEQLNDLILPKKYAAKTLLMDGVVGRPGRHCAGRRWWEKAFSIRCRALSSSPRTPVLGHLTHVVPRITAQVPQPNGRPRKEVDQQFAHHVCRVFLVQQQLVQLRIDRFSSFLSSYPTDFINNSSTQSSNQYQNLNTINMITHRTLQNSTTSA